MGQDLAELVPVVSPGAEVAPRRTMAARELCFLLRCGTHPGTGYPARGLRPITARSVVQPPSFGVSWILPWGGNNRGLAAAIPGSRIVGYEGTEHLELWDRHGCIAADLLAFMAPVA
ncbi:hypothetical protein GCM10023166_29590 [Paeniglutamicibacter cryotolerans]